MASETFISWIQLLTLFSAGIVLTDLILSNFIFGTRPYSFEYFVGNTLFGIIAFICLPLWFHIKRKRLNLSKANISEPSNPSPLLAMFPYWYTLYVRTCPTLPKVTTGGV